MIKRKYVFLICTLFFIYIILLHIIIISQDRSVDKLAQINNAHDKLIKTIDFSNNMAGVKLNNCSVSSVAETHLLSTLLSKNINIVFRFSNTSCSDCLKQQIDILKVLNDSSNCLLLSKFSNNRILSNFCKQEMNRNVYNLQNLDVLFDKEDDNQPLLAIVNNKLEIIAIYYCDEFFNKFYQILIPEDFLKNRLASINKL